MPLTITLSDIRIDDWSVDTSRRVVQVHYKRLRDDGSVYDDDVAYFWETMPDPGTDPMTGDPLPLPDNWYQLPAAHAQAIIDLTVDARQALGYLVGGF